MSESVPADLRLFRRWQPVFDPFDPGVGWTMQDVLQISIGGEWVDVPLVQEGELTDAIKRARLHPSQHWRLSR